MGESSGTQTGQPDATWYSQRCANFRAIRRYEDARRVASEGLARFPDDYELHCNLALALTYLDDIDAALPVAKRACGLDEQPEWACRVISFALATEGRDHGEEAIEWGLRALEYGTGVWEAHYALSQAYRTAHRFPEAHRHALLAVEGAPGLSTPLVELAWALIGTKRRGEAEEVARRALAIEPDSADAHHVLGVALGVQGKMSDAKTSLLRSKQIDPMNTAPDNSLSRVSKRSGNLATATIALFVVAAVFKVLLQLVSEEQQPLVLVIGLIVLASLFLSRFRSGP